MTAYSYCLCDHRRLFIIRLPLISSMPFPLIFPFEQFLLFLQRVCFRGHAEARNLVTTRPESPCLEKRELIWSLWSFLSSCPALLSNLRASSKAVFTSVECFDVRHARHRWRITSLVDQNGLPQTKPITVCPRISFAYSSSFQSVSFSLCCNHVEGVFCHSGAQQVAQSSPRARQICLCR